MSCTKHYLIEIVLVGDFQSLEDIFLNNSSQNAFCKKICLLFIDCQLILVFWNAAEMNKIRQNLIF